MKIKTLMLLTVSILLLLVACTSQPELPTEEPLEPVAYPVGDEENGYPISDHVFPTEEAYPIEETVSEFPQGPEFTIFTPISENDQYVKGSGPVGVPIILVSVSEVGLVLSETVIDSDGTFTFELDAPLTSGHLIGIQLGDITGTDFLEQDFLFSETYYERPFIGILFDMVTVQ